MRAPPSADAATDGHSNGFWSVAGRLSGRSFRKRRPLAGRPLAVGSAKSPIPGNISGARRIQGCVDGTGNGARMLRSAKGRWLGVGAVSVAGATVAVIALNRPPTGYGSLEDLVTDLGAAIEERDEERLAGLCRDPLGVPFERLARQHAALNYLTLLHEDRRWNFADS